MVAARWGAVLLPVLLLLVVPMANAAPYLQYQVDAARTGASPDPGPVDHIHQRMLDEAFTVTLPGLRAFAAPPLILDGSVYVLTGSPGPMARANAGPAAPAELAALAIFGIDLDTAEVEELATFETPATAWASDGDRFYVATQTAIRAYPLAGGPATWTWAFPQPLEGPSDATVCAPLAVAEDHLYGACTQFRGDGASSFAAGGQRTVVFALSHDGEERWTWTTEDSPVRQDSPSFLARGPGYEAGHVAVAGPVLAVSYAMTSRTDYIPPSMNLVMAFDRETGTYLWGEDESTFERQDIEESYSPDVVAHFPASGLVGTLQALYVRGEHLEAFGPATKEPLWYRPFQETAPETGSVPRWAGNILGLWDTTLYTMHRTDLHAIEAVDGATVWVQAPGGHPEDAGGLLVTRGVIYMANWAQRLYGYDRETGTLLIDQALGTFPFEDGPTSDQGPVGTHPLPVDRRVLIGVGEGVLAAAIWDGNLTVLGRTGASVQPAVTVSDPYPSPGQVVRADLSGTVPGALDPGLEFRADWGNGSTTDWQTEPVLEHTYGSRGEHQALFQARNPAGQTASEVVTFSVGGSPPEEAGFIETAFARENQGLTFGMIAILILLVGVTAVVVGRRRRDELHADRLAAYEQALLRDLDDGRSPGEITERLSGQRAVLGISEKEHARLLERLSAERTGVAVALVPGERFLGRYDVLHRLGAGGGGAAYLCKDTSIDRMVVIKALRSGPDDGGTERLVREARAFGAVNHENVVTLHDVEQVGDRVFLVLEHVDGGSLEDADEVGFQELAPDLLRALVAVHDADIVHRDVKPSNVLVSGEGRSKLADFGIAHLPDYESTIAGLGGGTAVGTIAYMSPEQARGREVDHRSDLYSAAVVLWEAFTGERYMAPEPGETATELQMRIAQADGLPRVPVEAPEALQAWLERALDPDPGQRFQTAEEMLEALEGVLTERLD